MKLPANITLPTLMGVGGSRGKGPALKGSNKVPVGPKRTLEAQHADKGPLQVSLQVCAGWGWGKGWGDSMSGFVCQMPARVSLSMHTCGVVRVKATCCCLCGQRHPACIPGPEPSHTPKPTTPSCPTLCLYAPHPLLSPPLSPPFAHTPGGAP